MLFFLFFVGISLGSFLNVVSLRYAPGQEFSLKKISGRSYCPKCKMTLRWYELLPLISFVLLWGRCRMCREKISWQYPIVELLSGLLFVFVPTSIFGVSDILGMSDTLILNVVLWIAVFWLLLLMSVIDIRRYIIPNAINIILLFLGAVAVFLKTFLPPFQQFFIGSYALLFQIPIFGMSDIQGMSDILILIMYHLVGFLVGGLFFWAVHALTRGKGMGFGDVKLGFALGFLLGWPDILFAMMFAFIVGGAWGVEVLIIRKIGSPSTSSGSTLKRRLPFGPFFATGTAMVVFFGRQILSWYFSLFSV